MARIALYGGSFDPPHFGHVLTSSAVMNSGLVDELWLVPSGLHRDKSTHASVEDRKAMMAIMLSTMFGSKVRITICNSQIDDSERVSTTIELLEELNNQYPRHKFDIVIGADLVSQISKWHRAQDLKRKTRFLVMPRPGFELPKRNPPHYRVLKGETLALTNVSSSAVREMIRANESLEGVVPPAVINHIIRNRLYR